MRIIMPKLGLTMTHGTITEWLAAPGDAIKAEQPLCAYETEKVTLELTAPEDGVLAEILVPAGTNVPAGEAVCEFRTAGEGASAGAPRAPERGEIASPPPAPAAAPVSPRASDAGPLKATPKARVLARELGIDLTLVAGRGPEGRIQAADAQAYFDVRQRGPVKATPLARRMAAAEGIDLGAITGAGPEGLITREDVQAALRVEPKAAAPVTPTAALVSAPAVAPPTAVSGGRETVVPLTSLRRTIAERMSASAYTAPHVTLFTDADASNLVSARSQLNAELPKERKIAYNTLLAALAARALNEYPQLNSRLEADGLHLLADINIALAIDTERGLMTPVLRNVDALNLPAIQQGYNDLAGRALNGRSLPQDFEGGTFTITNLGALEIDGFTPIINPPQAAILGVGRIADRPVAREGAVVVRPMITLSLSFDHRIVDGAPAARFLQRVKQLVERPLALLL
jgi:pyruvate dehydrogenase E2 component (dihydrolipoamide acetyltransferase)